MERPLIYLILGAAGSGRRALLADVIEGGLGGADRATVLVSENEPAGLPDTKLASLDTWRWIWAKPVPGEHDTPNAIEAEPPAEATHIFFVTDGRLNPVDQIEAFKAWFETRDLEFAHVITVVNCRLAERNPRLAAWYDACIHFSDIVLLNHREGVANKWLSDFQARYSDRFYPCVFELVKAGRVRNPAVVLEPRALRMSHIFDEEEWTLTNEKGEEVDEDDEEAEEEEGLTATPVEDIYIVRRAGGRREKEIPDIAKFLS